MDRDDELYRLAARQHALFARAQARALGFSRDAIRHRIQRGQWRPITPRVIGIVGAPPGRHHRLMAAVLDAGHGAVVARRSSAGLWGVPGFPASGPVELSRERGRSGRPPGIGHLFPVRYLPDHLVTTVEGVPTVSLPYLLFQLAGSERPERVQRALDNICTKSPAVHVRLHQLLPELAEHGRNGIVFMREWLSRNPPGSRVVASGLEARFERILVEAGERPLARQVDVGGHEWEGRADFVDRELGVVFEVDSILHHTSELDVALDEDRDARMLAAGFRAVVRIPEEWIWYDRDRAVAMVRAARAEARRALRRSGT